MNWYLIAKMMYLALRTSAKRKLKLLNLGFCALCPGLQSDFFSKQIIYAIDLSRYSPEL